MIGGDISGDVAGDVRRIRAVGSRRSASVDGASPALAQHGTGAGKLGATTDYEHAAALLDQISMPTGCPAVALGGGCSGGLHMNKLSLYLALSRKIRVLSLLWVIGAVTFSSPVAGAPVSVEAAEDMAVGYMSAMSLSQGGTGAAVVQPAGASEVVTGFAEALPVYHVVNLDPEGWVIVAADDVAAPIIGYSASGRYREQGHPPAFDAWMADVKAALQRAIESAHAF
jgi:hypothetical protein